METLAFSIQDVGSDVLSREGQPPKGNGDNRRVVLEILHNVGVPRGPTAERQWRLHEVSHYARRDNCRSREGQPPKGNGDPGNFETKYLLAFVSREGQPPKGNGDSPLVELPVTERSSRPERANRRKAMET